MANRNTHRVKIRLSKTAITNSETKFTNQPNIQITVFEKFIYATFFLTIIHPSYPIRLFLKRRKLKVYDNLTRYYCYYYYVLSNYVLLYSTWHSVSSFVSSGAGALSSVNNGSFTKHLAVMCYKKLVFFSFFYYYFQ